MSLCVPTFRPFAVYRALSRTSLTMGAEKITIAALAREVRRAISREFNMCIAGIFSDQCAKSFRALHPAARERTNAPKGTPTGRASN